MYRFDDSRWPLVIVEFRGAPNADEVARFKADLDALVDRVEPHALIYAFAEAEVPSREVIMDLVHWTRELRTRFRARYENRPDPIPTFTGYHMPPRLGALLRFFEQMVPAVRNQHQFFASLEEAIAAGQEALERFARTESNI